MGVGSGAASGVLAVEVCAPLVLLCWLCCWPDDSNSETSSSGRHHRRSTVESGSGVGSGAWYRGGRGASSAVSLHLPSTSGKLPASAHRSHEEIRNRSQLEDDTRYHSAPSIIHEVLHRRHWERSNRELHIPLNSPNNNDTEIIAAKPTETSIPCKKHHTNIKSSKGRREKKESTSDDVKDVDTEAENNFYIGEESAVSLDETKSHHDKDSGLANTESDVKLCTGKEEKQSLNESIKSRDHPGWVVGVVAETEEVFNYEEEASRAGRSGAVRHDAQKAEDMVYPPPSVDPIGWEGGACYLAEGTLWRSRAPLTGWRGAGLGAPPCMRGAGVGAGRGARGRLASDGDISAPMLRPQSGAFSESDLELDLAKVEDEERPPAYEELQQYATTSARETAI